jgi:mRNA interferase RelE/StbE
MARYKIEFKKSAVKELHAIPIKDIKKIISKMRALADDPRPQGSIKLSDQGKYRIRVGDYRILYSIEDDVSIIVVVKIGHRKDVYP